MAGAIAEGIAQIMHGYNGVGTEQFAFLVVTGCFFSVAAVYYIAFFLGNSPSVVSQVISAKASKICLKVDIS